MLGGSVLSAKAADLIIGACNQLRSFDYQLPTVYWLHIADDINEKGDLEYDLLAEPSDIIRSLHKYRRDSLERVSLDFSHPSSQPAEEEGIMTHSLRDFARLSVVALLDDRLRPYEHPVFNLAESLPFSIESLVISICSSCDERVLPQLLELAELCPEQFTKLKSVRVIEICWIPERAREEELREELKSLKDTFARIGVEFEWERGTTDRVDETNHGEDEFAAV